MDLPVSTTTQPASASRQIARAAGTVMIAFILTQLLGLLRGIVNYQVFGTTADMDSFNAANRVTEVLFNLMAGGALGSAFIPTFTGLLAREQHQTAWKLASAIANLLLLVLTAISFLAWIFAPQIVRHVLFLLAPDQPVGQEVLTVHLLRTMLPSVVIFGLSGLVMGILNAHQKFWLPAIAPAMYSLGQILGVLLLPASLGISRLAIGALAGSFMHLCVQLPQLLRQHGSYTATLGLYLADVREVLLLMGPRMLGVAVVQINFVVNTIIGLSLPEGSVSSLALAFTWMLMPQTAIAQSIAIAAMPTFSAQAALGKMDEMRHSLASSLRGVLLLAVPASVGLILLRHPLIQLLYQHGEFTAQSTQMVTWALMWYVFSLVFYSLLEVIVRAFYALHDTRTPVTVTIITMGLNVVFSLTFPGWFSRLGWMPLGGLALASSLANTLECIVLIILLRRRLHGLQGTRLWSAVAQSLLAAAAMGLALWGWLALTANWSLWAILLVGIVLGGGIYGLGLLILRVPELFRVLDLAREKIRTAVSQRS
jgi:putative peptidoglycan lipid II flippase